MHWILQNTFIDDPTWKVMISTFNRFDIPYSIHKIIPFIHEITPEPIIQNNKVICFGSYGMRHIAKKYSWNPGVYDLENFDFLKQKVHWKNNLLNYDSEVIKFKDAKINTDKFIRPINDTKTVSGKIFCPDEFNIWASNINKNGDKLGYSIDIEEYIQINDIKSIVAEYRFFIVNNTIITASQYKLGSRIIYKLMTQYEYKREFKFVNDMISIWSPHKAFVIDIAEVDGEDLKIVEINTINFAGLYGADVQKLILSLEDAEESKLYD